MDQNNESEKKKKKKFFFFFFLGTPRSEKGPTIAMVQNHPQRQNRAGCINAF